jgi:hypothetical protein
MGAIVGLMIGIVIGYISGTSLLATSVLAKIFGARNRPATGASIVQPR